MIDDTSPRDGMASEAALPFVASCDPARRLSGKCILIVEDEPLVALLLTDSLEEAGATIAGLAATVEEALRFSDTEAIDAVILDCNLNGRAVDDVASVLPARDVPFLFVSGYGPDGMPPGFGNAPVLGKPFAQVQLPRGGSAGRGSGGPVRVKPLAL